MDDQRHRREAALADYRIDNLDGLVDLAGIDSAHTAAARLDIQLDDVRVLAAPLSVADGTLTGTEKPVWDAVLAAEVVPTGARVDTPTDAAARALK